MSTVQEEEEEFMTAQKDNGVAADHDDDDDDDDDEIPIRRFQKQQRVYAKDGQSGLLYKAIVRRHMHGSAPPKQLRVGVDSGLSTKNINVLLERNQEPMPPTWHYFVHYLGWNVKWDRWMEEDSLFEDTEKNKQLSDMLAKELNLATKKIQGKKQPQTQYPLLDLAKRMEHIEKQHLEGGINMQQDAGTTNQEEVKPRKKNRFNKSAVTKELQLRSSHLTGNLSRNSNPNFTVVLPLVLKKIMVEEWEIITQCHMVPKLPAQLSIEKALNMFCMEKIKHLQPPEPKKKSFVTEDTNPLGQQGSQVTAIGDEAIVREVLRMCSKEKELKTAETKEPNSDDPPGHLGTDSVAVPKEQDGDEAQDMNDEKQLKIQEWKDMVNGICLLFDQAFRFRLLYPQEESHEYEDEKLYEAQPCQVYGCEHLLRLLVQIPTLLSQLQANPKRIVTKLHDLIRYLQKHQSTLFTQCYTRAIAEERKRKRKRKRDKTAPKTETTVTAKQESPLEA